ncbi:ABC transporter ATP-binding protein [Nonomuraea sp. NPDC048826]|uniref:ABC transporter ATP-binding protein n=1 Tax=Nonomuraea sp. NPDC048826 TaxID=3364347 RepID=UPI0037107299
MTLSSSRHPDARSGPSGVVELLGVSKTYGSTTAVESVDLTFESGEFIAILGPSGCGKSTLLGILGGFIAPSAGDVRIGGRSLLGVAPERRPTAMVFQSLALFPHLSVAGNIAYGLKARGVPRNQVKQEIQRLLELVRMPGYGARRVAELSGGQRQRVAIARALAVEPQVLLLDEPLSALDAQMRKAMQLELRAIQSSLGMTFVYVTHDQHEAMSMADRIVVMGHGKVVQQGTPHEMYLKPRSVYVAEFLGDANTLSRDEIARSELGSLRDIVGSFPDVNTFALRPEHLDLKPAGPDTGAVVRHATFFGAHVRYELDAGIGEPLVVIRPGGETAFAPGERVEVSVSPAHVIPLSEEP